MIQRFPKRTPTSLLHRQHPTSHGTFRRIFGEPVWDGGDSENLGWKIQFGDNASLKRVLLSPSGINILVGYDSGILELRGMKGGSLIRRYPSSRISDSRFQGEIGFLSRDGDVIASSSYRGCFVHYSDASMVDVMAKLNIPTDHFRDITVAIIQR